MLNESFNDQNVPDYFNNCYTIQTSVVTSSSNCLYNQDTLFEIKKKMLNYNDSQVEKTSRVKLYHKSDTPFVIDHKNHLTLPKIQYNYSDNLANKENLDVKLYEKYKKEKLTDCNNNNIFDNHQDHDYDLRHKTTMKRGYCEDNEATFDKTGTKRCKSTLVSVREMQMNSFFQLLENKNIKSFLERDACCLISDKYALAMVFTYFKRAKLELSEYTKTNFYLALYLANDIEEDCDEYKYEIFPWALGRNWRKKFQAFLKARDKLLIEMKYRAMVSRKSCEEVMILVPNHYAWNRNRPLDHGGAVRSYIIRKIDLECGQSENYIDDGVLLPRGPDSAARPCPLCVLRAKKTIEEIKTEKEVTTDDEDTTTDELINNNKNNNESEEEDTDNE